jgi:hypothetical protein
MFSARGLASLVVFLYLVFAAVVSLTLAIDLPTQHLDGAFQTASSLFRLDQGFFPGKHFFPYLGLGPIFSIYPIFAIAGADLAATVVAAHLVTLVTGWISVAVLFQLIFRPLSFLSSLAGGAVILTLHVLISEYFEIGGYLIQAGNSLRPVRAFVPYLLSLAVFFLLRSGDPLSRRPGFAGLALGLVLLWSNDYGIPTAGLFGLFFVTKLYFEDQLNWAKNTLILTVSTIVATSIFLVLATLGHPLELIKYNFGGVATDQWWLFAPYAEARRVFRFSQIVKVFTGVNIVPLLVLTTVFFVTVRSKRAEHVLLLLIGLVLFAGGSLASVGGHIGGYFSGFGTWAGLTTIFFLFKKTKELFIGAAAKRASSLENLPSKPLLWSVTAFMLVVALHCAFTYQTSRRLAKQDTNRMYVPELGGYLHKQWDQYVQLARSHRGRNTLEEYWGLWSAIHKSFSDWPVDSVIHALGHTRSIAELSIDRADLVITTRYAASPEWQPWNLSQNFWFYERLLKHWQPEHTSPSTVVWKKLGRERGSESVPCKVTSDRKNIEFSRMAEGFHSLEVVYKASGSGRYLLMFRNNISFGNDANGYVSLPLGKSVITLPVALKRDAVNTLDLRVVGNERVNGWIESCTAKKINLDYPEVLHPLEPLRR